MSSSSPLSQPQSPSSLLTPLQTLKETILGLLNPWVFLSLSASYLPRTILSLIQQRRYSVLLSPSRLREAWFTEFWTGFAGPNIRLNAGPRVVVPLLQGRTTGGDVTDAPVGPPISGTVIEVGAGAGMWVDVYRQVADIRAPEPGSGEVEEEKGEVAEGLTKRKTGGNSDGEKGVITRVYGVEPNPNQHPHLRRAIAAAGLEDVYQIVPVGIEDLDNESAWDGRVEKGSVDCVVSILCLCSIPEPEKNIRELYSYLKKGGRWYVYEHVRCEYSWYMRLYQRVVNVFWPYFLGGCLLSRPTETTIRKAGSWEKIDVGQPPIEQWYGVVPHMLGVFTK
ncbi:S-adenosyl-L-methionine-dependent methyltransferase [Annulohypoxylon truncatum]|uniref:S-adenosyl-L-methionine-dependent methyltransferase n=1 Tax=Annulohypoxylon truncatum TaxID=327061 RepID=UPI0020088ED2|nr:S-adenosyl-L-methionine-dependent methyltransferase [Annulohypoxylon truncatum]KAI1211570.1 S-adenosyl-L-methionine-dependent methyltransferase [Annulohypoxylon truncatum]